MATPKSSKAATNKAATTKTATSKAVTSKAVTSKAAGKAASKAQTAKALTTRAAAPQKGSGAMSASLPSVIASYHAAFQARDDLRTFNDNARLLFALEVRFDLPDIHTVASNALVDGGDDKKCDLIWVDRDMQIAVIAQGYESRKPRTEAPANKATDLNSAINWILAENIGELPLRLRTAAQDLRTALNSGEITRLYVWFVHNCPESQNVKNELKAVTNNLRRILRERGWESTQREVVEVGESMLAEWYHAVDTPIRVSSKFELTVPGAYTVNGQQNAWKAISTAIPLEQLRQIFRSHGENLFSANVRSYLGLRQTGNDINFGIRNSAENTPENFWVYNNGLTVLVNDFEHLPGTNKLTIEGFSVVNGAQTTGAIGNIDNVLDPNALVPVRFVKTSNRDVIQEVINYNNKQNRTNAADFRSNDRIQKRLKEEFQRDMPEVTYLGGRRGGYEDARRRYRNLIDSDAAAQALAAFHGNPALAYFRKGQIWENDEHYSTYFRETTTARHLLFVYALLRAIQEKKLELRRRKADGEITKFDQRVYDFLGGRGSIYLLIAAIGQCMETVSGKSISDVFSTSFGAKKLAAAIRAWEPIVRVTAPFVSALEGAVAAGLKEEDAKKAVDAFVGLVESVKAGNLHIYQDFTKQLRLG